MEDNQTRPMSFREMAARCREMAAATRRPGSLLNRAAVYDANAAEIERAAPTIDGD